MTFNWRQWRYYIGKNPVATFSEFQKLSKKLVENSGFYYFRSIDGGIQKTINFEKTEFDKACEKFVEYVSEQWNT